MTHLQIITKDDMAVSNLKFLFSVIICTRWWQTQCITSSPLTHCSCSMMLQAIALHGSYSNICSWTVTPLIQLGSWHLLFRHNIILHGSYSNICSWTVTPLIQLGYWYLLFRHNTAWVIFQLSLFLNCDTIHTSWILICLFTTSCLKHLQWSHCQFSQMLTKLYMFAYSSTKSIYPLWNLSHILLYCGSQLVPVAACGLRRRTRLLGCWDHGSKSCLRHGCLSLYIHHFSLVSLSFTLYSLVTEKTP
jgi:hypothetical protein